MVLGIYGSGGAGKELKEMAELIGKWDEVVFIDDMTEPDIFKGIKRMPFDCFKKLYSVDIAEVTVSLGEPAYKVMLRERVMQVGYRMANVIHPTAWISPTATIGNGVTMDYGVNVNADCTIGDGVSIMGFSAIGHDTIIEENTQISAGVLISGHCFVGRNTFIAAGVPVKEGISIGRDSIVGLGSVVLRDIPDNVIAMGNPARAMKHKDDQKVF